MASRTRRGHTQGGWRRSARHESLRRSPYFAVDGAAPCIMAMIRGRCPAPKVPPGSALLWTHVAPRT